MADLRTTLTRDHVILSPRLEDLRRLADDAPTALLSDLVDGMDAAVDFLVDDLLPHFAAEEAVLYPAIAELLGRPEAVATMTRDHEEIRRLVHQLRRHRDELAGQLLAVARHLVQRDLYVLHALTALHIAKEEELLFPLLQEHTSAAKAARLPHDLQHAREIAGADGLIADGG